ncbi:DUF6538 domain-containing protein [Burkholderia sp. F1]|uniref:DUF6538 domain-containing protein n=1 Tax=Burkholderia sp. F1 TaxID=3366817 RepID=UPI003D754C0A
MTDLATLPTGVYLRPGSSVFHLRIGVPKDLQQHFRNPNTGKPKVDAFRASLRTSNRAEAGTRAHEIIAESPHACLMHRLERMTQSCVTGNAPRRRSLHVGNSARIRCARNRRDATPK